VKGGKGKGMGAGRRDEDLGVCAALCLSTATCTKIYFIQGSNCNLYYGPDAFNNGI
jgi:hypothetical protein